MSVRAMRFPAASTLTFIPASINRLRRQERPSTKRGVNERRVQRSGSAIADSAIKSFRKRSGLTDDIDVLKDISRA